MCVVFKFWRNSLNRNYYLDELFSMLKLLSQTVELNYQKKKIKTGSNMFFAAAL